MTWMTLTEAQEADAACPLRAYRHLFDIDPSGPIYLDGNSLGRPPRATAEAVAALMGEWAANLVGAWERWADLPTVVGDRVGQLIGAAPGQVVVADSTSVNLFKLASAALDARPGRTAIVGDANDFPTVRYVLQGLAASRGYDLRLVGTEPEEGVTTSALAGALGPDVALCCLSAVNYRSGAVADMAGANRLVHENGALTLWDLSHAAGAVPMQLDESHTDLAVGCGYKYLNGGPGAPAWLYVRAGLQEALRQPIWGWWGQQDQFEMGPEYEPAPGVGRFLSGTPAVLGLVALGSGIDPLLQVGMAALWKKTKALMTVLAQGVEQVLAPLGARSASPRDPERRGGHLAVTHPHAWAATRLLRQRRLMVPDFRPPDVLRLAPVAIYTSYVDIYEAVHRTASVLSDPAVEQPAPKARIT